MTKKLAPHKSNQQDTLYAISMLAFYTIVAYYECHHYSQKHTFLSFDYNIFLVNSHLFDNFDFNSYRRVRASGAVIRLGSISSNCSRAGCISVSKKSFCSTWCWGSFWSLSSSSCSSFSCACLITIGGMPANFATEGHSSGSQRLT